MQNDKMSEVPIKKKLRLLDLQKYLSSRGKKT